MHLVRALLNPGEDVLVFDPAATSSTINDIRDRVKLTTDDPAYGRRAETYTSAFLSDHMVNLLMETQGRLPCPLTGQRDSSFKCSETKGRIS